VNTVDNKNTSTYILLHYSEVRVVCGDRFERVHLCCSFGLRVKVCSGWVVHASCAAQ
jgi:hypothetical protein